MVQNMPGEPAHDDFSPPVMGIGAHYNHIRFLVFGMFKEALLGALTLSDAGKIMERMNVVKPQIRSSPLC